ncbi:MAG: glycosyltransferase family 2 protein [Patescibacteria group bacterium]
MKLSVVIPAYNEEKTILEIIRRVRAAESGLEKEIIIVNDSSKDGTAELLKGVTGLKVINLTPNRGKGGALKAGIKESIGDIVIFQDADLEYDPNDYEAMVKPILDGKTKVTNGVRIETRLSRERDFVMIGVFGWLGNHAITWTTNLLYWHNAGEYEGCYKAFESKLLKSIEVKTNDFDFDNELLCKILKKGYKPIDVPIHYHPRGYAEGKKINWRHGFKILWTIIKYRFVS